MKILFLFFIVTASLASHSDIDCQWKYKCCKLIKGYCVKMCEPEIYCPETTTQSTFAGFAPVQALNVRCKFGYKVDGNFNCRRVLK